MQYRKGHFKDEPLVIESNHLFCMACKVQVKCRTKPNKSNCERFDVTPVKQRCFSTNHPKKVQAWTKEKRKQAVIGKFSSQIAKESNLSGQTLPDKVQGVRLQCVEFMCKANLSSNMIIQLKVSLSFT